MKAGPSSEVSTPRYRPGGTSLFATAAAMARVLKRRRNPRRTTRNVKRRISRRSTLSKLKRRVRYRRNRRSKYDNSTAHRELTKTTLKTGRPFRKTLRNLWKANPSSKLIVGIQEISRFGGASGQRPLSFTQTVGNAPCYAKNVVLFPITNCINWKGSTLQYPPGIWTPVLSNESDTATISWQSDFNLSVLDSRGDLVDRGSFPLDISMLSWVNLKIILYNALNAPGKYMIELVSFKDDRLLPEAENVNPEDIQFTAAFWQAQIKPYMYNPIAMVDTRYERYKKVHKRLFINMDSKDTDQTTSTNYKEINFFARLNKRCRYNYSHTDRMRMWDADVQTNLGDNELSVHPKARMYIMIRSLCSTAGMQYPVNYSNTVMASMDYTLKMCHRISK